MILGTGIDIVDVDRIGAALAHPRTGERFRLRVFTPNEITYCSRRRNAHESYAARFAAKEAMMKALGEAFGWREIEVIRENGPPAIRLHGRAQTRAAELGIRYVHLSLSHTATMAIASVITES
jgi:holo-[acyl-carrier protein] synthase